MVTSSIDKVELNKALAELAKAESRGFMFCVPVFGMASIGSVIIHTKMVFKGLVVRADDTNGKYDWGMSPFNSENKLYETTYFDPTSKKLVEYVKQ